jgi:hypothetical protein
MNISEIAINRHPELRRVSVTFPSRLHVMERAIRLYEDLGLDVELDDDTITYRCGKVAAPLIAGVLERMTGIRADNAWECA